MTARAVGPTSAPSGSTGTSRQPRTVRPSSSAILATASMRAERSFSSVGRKAMPTEYSPSGGSSKSTLARRSASGVWGRIPAPSPGLGSGPAAPRGSRLCSAVSPAETMRRLRLPRTSATKATPQASLSFAGSYRPVADGTAENGTAAGAGWLDMSLPSSADARASERGHGRGRRPGPVVKGGDRRGRAGTGPPKPMGGGPGGFYSRGGGGPGSAEEDPAGLPGGA